MARSPRRSLHLAKMPFGGKGGKTTNQIMPSPLDEWFAIEVAFVHACTPAHVILHHMGLVGFVTVVVETTVALSLPFLPFPFPPLCIQLATQRTDAPVK